MKKVKINGEYYTLINKEYDFIQECHYYFVEETEQVFNDLDDDITEYESEEN